MIFNSDSDRKFDGPISDPQIVDVFSLMKRETMLDINCVQIGTIESYNSVTNTAQVSINVKRKLKNGDELEYPTLEDCPVFMLHGGTSSITMPISSGDGCLVLFNDRCIEDWFLMGDVVAPADKRVHSLSDGIVLVGVKPMIKQLIPLSSNLCINAGSNKVAIKNTVVDLKTQLNDIITSINKVIDLISDMCDQVTTVINGNLATTQPFVGTIALVSGATTGTCQGLTTIPLVNAATFATPIASIAADKASLAVEKLALTAINTQLNLLLSDS
jgi:hypothetical protein